MTTPQIAFIGAGNMASSLIRGLIDSGYPATRILASNPSVEKLNLLRQQFQILITQDNSEAAKSADIVILAVKPQKMREVAENLNGLLQEKALVISIAAGVRTVALQRWLNHDRIIRCMPNTPSQVKLGVSGLFARPQITEPERQLATALFNTVGMTLWVETESLIDSVTAVSGSGPAYLFYFMELMTQSAVELGLDPEEAQKMVIQTTLGAATLAAQSHDSLAELRRKVTSPGGTTERAIQRFSTEHLNKTIEHAMQECAQRAIELSQQLETDL